MQMSIHGSGPPMEWHGAVFGKEVHWPVWNRRSLGQLSENLFL